jgi:hypothetical protein
MHACRSESKVAFTGRALNRDERGKTLRQIDSGSPISQGVPRDLVTTSRACQLAVQQCAIAERSSKAAGQALSRTPVYNIISGGSALTNNPKFECYTAGAVVRKARAS